MLVNISYSVDFEEVPEVVNRFLRDDIKKMIDFEIAEGVIEAIDSLEPEKENIGKCIKTIESIRELLMKVDMRLSDCSNILIGYSKYMIDQVQNQDSSEPGDMSELQEELKNLKQTLEDSYNETAGG
jgi:hypothetical protein